MKKLLLALVLGVVLGPNLPAQITTNDIGLLKITSNIWARPGDEFVVQGQFKTFGTQVLQEANFNWSVADGETQVFHMTGINLSKSRDSVFVHPQTLAVTGTDDILIKIWVSDPNGQTDEKSRNDTLYHTVQVIGDFPERHIVLEEFTGAWCGWCPRGPITYRDQILPNYPNVILAALHNGDDMVFADGNTVVSAYASSFPSGMIDRRAVGNLPTALGTNDWITALNQMDTEFTPAAIQVYNYYYPDTYEWKIDVVVDFIMDYSGDLRLNCFVLEDGVTGRGSGFDQSNYYDTRTDIPELRGIGNPVVGYEHNHVVRDMLGGPWGQAGIIPSKVKRGDRYIFTKTIKPRMGSDIRQMKLVGILQAYGSTKENRPILNAVETEVHLATGYSWNDISTGLQIYPNPTQDHLIAEIESDRQEDCRLEIFNSTGQIIYQTNFRVDIGTLRKSIDTKTWDAGIYFVKVLQGNRIETSRVIKN